MTMCETSERDARSLFESKHLSDTVKRQYERVYKFVQGQSYDVQQVLKLTTQLLEHNRNNYTVWHGRRQCLMNILDEPAHDTSFRYDLLMSELDFVRAHCSEAAKCYQVWYHRRWVIQQLGDSGDELSKIEQDLTVDQKNMNLWEYRTFLTQRHWLNHCCEETSRWTFTRNVQHSCQCRFNEEMAFANQMIALDFRNNSAWNHRCTSVHLRASTLSPKASCDVLFQAARELFVNEILHCLEYCKKASHNEPCWNVLRSFFLRETQLLPSVFSSPLPPKHLPYGTGHLLYDWNDSGLRHHIRETIDQVLQKHGQNRFALYVLYLCHLTDKNALLTSQVLQQLSRVDSIREGYWMRKLLLFEAEKKCYSEESS